MKVEFVRELTGFQGDACLVKRGDQYFVVSSVNAFMSGPETLVFPADEDGDVTNWGEVAGGRGTTRDEAIDDLANLTSKIVKD